MELGLWFRRPAVQGALWGSDRLRVAQRVLVALDHIHAAAISAAVCSGVSVMHTVPITEGYAVRHDSLGLVLFGRDPTDYPKQLSLSDGTLHPPQLNALSRQNCSAASSILTPSWKSENSGEHPSRCPASAAETISRASSNKSPKFCWFGDKHGHVILHARVCKCTLMQVMHVPVPRIIRKSWSHVPVCLR